MTEAVLRGEAAAGGIGIGHAYVLDQRHAGAVIGKVTALAPREEIARFDGALAESRRQLAATRERIVLEFGEDYGYLVEAQLLALEDANLIAEIRENLRRESVCAEYAVAKGFADLCAMLDRVEDPYFKERFADVRVVERRLLDVLTGRKRRHYVAFGENTVVIARSLTPIDLVKFPKSQVSGIVLEEGGRTSHLSIMCRAMGIPCVVGIDLGRARVEDGIPCAVDGDAGTLILAPAESTRARLEGERRQRSAKRDELLKNRVCPAVTSDGRRIGLRANVDFLDEVSAVKLNGAEGVGMLRTESLFLGRAFPPAEDLQADAYESVVVSLAPEETVIRLFDVDPGCYATEGARGASAHDANPALGLRGVRFLMRDEGVARAQVRAILRAAAAGRVGILIPMVTSVQDVRWVTRVIKEEAEALRDAGIAHSADVGLGAMIEVPSAALTADAIAREVDFLAIGTNDLVQYALGVDRANPAVADLYDPLHPAVLGLIESIVAAARRRGVTVGVCGEIASDPRYAPLLLGLELDFLSVHPYATAEVKQAIGKISFAKARAWARRLVGADTPAHAHALLAEWPQEPAGRARGKIS